MKDEPLHADADIEMSHSMPPGFMQEISNPAFDSAIRGFDNPIYSTTKVTGVDPGFSFGKGAKKIMRMDAHHKQRHLKSLMAGVQGPLKEALGVVGGVWGGHACCAPSKSATG